MAGHSFPYKGRGARLALLLRAEHEVSAKASDRETDPFESLDQVTEDHRLEAFPWIKAIFRIRSAESQGLV